MKTALIVFLLTLLTAFGQAPPYQRQFFDTNTDPVVQVTAGSNCWVTFTTTEPAGQVRTFRVDVPSSGGGTTNIILIATNDVYDVNMTAGIDGYTQGVWGIRIGQTNYYRMLIGGEAYGIKVYTNADGIILSNLYPNIYWFTNPAGELHWSSNSAEVATGSISNNYNVGIRGLLSLYGTNPSVPFIEFRTAGILYSNTFVGRLAGQSNATGVGNTFLGHAAGNKNISGNYNTFVGASAGAADIAGPHNTAVGNGALKKTTSNTGQNTVVGSQAMRDATTAQNNVAIGFESLWASLNSSDNVIVGTSATSQQGPGGHNVVVGNSVGVGWTNSSYNTAIGDFAMYVAAASAPRSNTALGHEAGQAFTQDRNVAIGSESLRDVSLGMYNTALGFYSGLHQIQGSNNLYLGDFIGSVDTNFVYGSSNIMMGIGGRTVMRYHPDFQWKVDDSLNARYNLTATQAIALGYPTLLSYTNVVYTNTYEASRNPGTNITFTMLVPTNVVIQVWSNNGINPPAIVSNWIYGCTGMALINVPFYTASASTNAPAWNEFVTRDYVDTHSTTGGVASSLSVKTNGTVFSAGVSNLNFIGASGSNGPDGTANITITGAGTNFVYTTTNTQWGAIQDFVTNNYTPSSDLTGVVFNSGGETNKAGLNSVATGSSVAIGSGPLATDNSVAIGVSPIADAYGIAIGANAIGTNAGVAIGNGARAGAGDYNIAIGHLAQIETAGFTRTTQIGPRTGNSASNGFLHYLDWPYLDRSGLGNFSNLVTVKEYVSDSLIVTNRAVSGTNGPNNGTNQTVITWNNFAQTNGASRVVVSNGIITTSGAGNFGGSVDVAGNLSTSGYLLMKYAGLLGSPATQAGWFGMINVSGGTSFNGLTFGPLNTVPFVSTIDWGCTNWPTLAVAGSTNNPTLRLQGGTNTSAGASLIVNSNLGIGGSLYGTNGGTFGAAVTTTSTSTNDPAPTEFVVAGWVRGLFINGFVGYNSSNAMVNGIIGARFTTNFFEKFGGYGFVYSNSIPDSFTRVYSSVTTSQYLGAAVITNLTQILGPVVVSSYIGFPSGGGRSLSVKPEIYYTYGTNGYGTNELFGDWDAGERVITAGTTNRYDWVIPVPYTVSTNGTFTVVRSFKVTAQTANPNVTIGGGTNWPSQISYNSAMSPVGQTIYASNILSGGAIGSPVKLSGSFESNTCGVATFDFSKPRQFTNTTTDITFSAVTGQHAVDVRTVALTITNASGSVKLLTIPGAWNSPTNVYHVTNVSILSVESWGTYMTNAVCRGIK